MRGILFASLMIGASTSAAAQNDRVFDFMGQDTVSPTNMTEVFGYECSVEERIRDCTGVNGKLAGEPIKGVTLKFHDEKLYMVVGSAWGRSFPALLDAFTAKYGEPQLEEREWRNAAGAVLDSTAASWDFAGGGKLELVSRGASMNEAEFVFSHPANSPPQAEPLVDF